MKKESRKQKKGISLIALIITIIVIVLLAAIVVNTSINTPASANLAKFAQNMGELQQAVTLSYSDIYVTEAVKATPRTNAEIYREIAGGVAYPSALPAGIDGDFAWKVNDASKLNSIETLPEGDFYITDKGVIFSASGYENNGEIFLTASVKVDRVLELPEGLIANGSWDNVKGVNTPKLVTGMIPIYFDDNGNEIEVTSPEDEWYDYDTKKWANAKSENSEGVTTAYWVWIPRYAYQITTNLGNGGEGISGNINIKFLQGTTNKDSENDDVRTTYPTVTDNNAMTDFVVHPAFTSNISLGGWDKELSGIWVAKFMAGYAMDRDGNGTSDVENGNILKPVASDVNYSQTRVRAGAVETGTGSVANILARNWVDGIYGTRATKIKYPVFLPQTIAMCYISVGDSYSICRAMENTGNIYGFNSSANTHLMKNSEWGAVAYLTQSSKGKNDEITRNSATLKNGGVSTTAEDGNIYASAYGVTGNGDIGTISSITANAWADLYTSSSSTGNVSGIYDLRGCLWDRVASYVANGSDYLTSYGGSFASRTSPIVPSTKYTTVYKSYESSPVNQDTGSEQNYNGLKADKTMYGDAMIEISNVGVGTTSWYGDYSYFPNLGAPFFVRGGSNGDDTVAGVFTFSRSSGGADNRRFPCGGVPVIEVRGLDIRD